MYILYIYNYCNIFIKCCQALFFAAWGDVARYFSTRLPSHRGKMYVPGCSFANANSSVMHLFCGSTSSASPRMMVRASLCASAISLKLLPSPKINSSAAITLSACSLVICISLPFSVWPYSHRVKMHSLAQLRPSIVCAFLCASRCAALQHNHRRWFHCGQQAVKVCLRHFVVFFHFKISLIS